ncbi:MAG: cell division protein FtsX, partial [Gammaproteobacteria bacterium]
MTQSSRKTFSTQGVRLLNGKGALRDRLKAYGIIHAHDLISSLGRQIRSPFTTLLTMLVLSIAVSFAAGFYIFVSNAQQLTGNLQATNQISVYLKHQIDDEQGMLLAGQIERLPDVQSVGVISKETALKEFQSFGGFGNAV